MNTKIHFIIAVVLSGIVFHPLFVRAQGPLTPPGAPAPTMKTLSQIEARTPVSSAPFTISSSGSYYLTTNLTVSTGSAITINANNVRLDLNGFTLSSTENPATTGCGILLSAIGVTNIAIINGFISSGVTNNSSGVFGGSGFGSGIYGVVAVNTRITGVSVSGCRINGIVLGVNSDYFNTVVESCTVNMVGSSGIIGASVNDSTAVNCGGTAIAAFTANNCYGTSLSLDGVSCSSASNCYGATSSTSVGLAANTASNCAGLSNGGDGVIASTASTCIGSDIADGTGVSATIAIGCYGYSSLGTGLSATIANSCGSNSGDAAITYKYNMP
jgi:hypothetical protein